YERALAIRERLAAAHPDQVRYQIDLAQSLSARYPGPKTFSDLQGYSDQLRRNADRLEAMVAAYPAAPEIRRALLELYHDFAYVRTGLGDMTGRLDCFRRSLDHLRRLPGPPGEIEDNEKVTILMSIADTLRAVGRSSEVLAQTTEAVALGERLVA